MVVVVAAAADAAAVEATLANLSTYASAAAGTGIEAANTGTDAVAELDEAMNVCVAGLDAAEAEEEACEDACEVTSGSDVVPADDGRNAALDWDAACGGNSLTAAFAGDITSRAAATARSPPETLADAEAIEGTLGEEADEEMSDI